MTIKDSSRGFERVTHDEIESIFNDEDYVANDEVITSVLLALRLEKSLLVEGLPGSGKTEIAKVLASGFETELIRLQCYEGLPAESALYEWNYAKQLLAVQGDDTSMQSEASSVFDEEYLLERPLLRALAHDKDETPPVLLIDEVDRADEEFEAFLLEVLSDYQVSIPELGTIEASTKPIVIITSNRTRGLSDALKRRCLYLHVTPPSFEKEYKIVRRKVPDLNAVVAAEVCGTVQKLREETLLREPGVAETLDWARAVATLRESSGDDETPLTRDEIKTTLGCLLKEVEDVSHVDDDVLEELQQAAEKARSTENINRNI
jgi:MoxR-like ATPase